MLCAVHALHVSCCKGKYFAQFIWGIWRLMLLCFPEGDEGVRGTARGSSPVYIPMLNSSQACLPCFNPTPGSSLHTGRAPHSLWQVLWARPCSLEAPWKHTDAYLTVTKRCIGVFQSSDLTAGPHTLLGCSCFWLLSASVCIGKRALLPGASTTAVWAAVSHFALGNVIEQTCKTIGNVELTCSVLSCAIQKHSVINEPHWVILMLQFYTHHRAIGSIEVVSCSSLRGNIRIIIPCKVQNWLISDSNIPLFSI